MHRLTQLYFDLKKQKPDLENQFFHDAVINAILEHHTEEEVEWAIRRYIKDTLVYIARGIDRMMIQRAAEEVQNAQKSMHTYQPLSLEIIAHNRYLYERKKGKTP